MTLPFNCQADARDIELLGAIENGLPLVARPFAQIARELAMSEDEVLGRFERMRACGIIRRFGLVLQHRPLGYRANAMVVWDIPDQEVNDAAKRIIAHDFVTLCYARRRARPRWPYNLYCMIHGRERALVEQQIAHLKNNAALTGYASRTLFSRRRFKQTGAKFSPAKAHSINMERSAP